MRHCPPRTRLRQRASIPTRPLRRRITTNRPTSPRPQELLNVPAAGEVVTDVGVPAGRREVATAGKGQDAAGRQAARPGRQVGLSAHFAGGVSGLGGAGGRRAVVELLRTGGGVRQPRAGTRYLAVFLALATIITVFVISTCYSHIIEEFPSGGGGYLVASKLLGPRVGVVSGCALLVDYVLTITVSIAAAGDALFGVSGPGLGCPGSCTAKSAAIIVLIVLNLRGVKESVTILMPIFLVFLVTHAMLIVGAVSLHVADGGAVVARGRRRSPQRGWPIRNSACSACWPCCCTPIRWAPARTPASRPSPTACPSCASRAWPPPSERCSTWPFSLAFTAGGLMVAYLLLERLGDGRQDDEPGALRAVDGRHRARTEHWPGTAFIFVTILSEGALLFVAAQAGFIDGPRVLANMAHDSWMPHWFANLSERLATHNGILLMGLSALAALIAVHAAT